MINLEDKIFTIMEKGPSQKVVTGLLNAGLKTPVTRKKLLAGMDRALYRLSMKSSCRPLKVRQDRYYMGRALLRSIGRAFDSDLMAPSCTRALSDILIRKVILEGVYTRREFRKKHGFRPPTFVTISPTNVCNLKCKGCYAGIYTKNTLSTTYSTGF